jgi:2-oxoisovalerate dehydrogenase E1 component beta subunit
VPWSTHPGGDVPQDYYTLPIGRVEVVEEGEDLTILCYGTMVHVAQAAAADVSASVEIIDIRTLLPLDVPALKQSVEKTGRCIVLHEATRFSGYGAELAATVQEQCFYSLEAPVRRVCGWDTPYPHAFEWEYFPGKHRVRKAIEEVLEEG